MANSPKHNKPECDKIMQVCDKILSKEKTVSIDRSKFDFFKRDETD